MAHTIFALSSGKLPSGVAVIRVSGPQVPHICYSLIGPDYLSRHGKPLDFVDPFTDMPLDKGLFLVFPAPNSFTGEDVCEFQCHGGTATVERFFEVLRTFPETRLADAGEFSRRAFENDKLDLTSAEGLSDLISARTEMQRRQALSQSSGKLRDLSGDWRNRLIKARALVEASFDFSDEDDVSVSLEANVWSVISGLLLSVQNHLEQGQIGEIIRDGFNVVLMGPPNSGKSSVLNTLASRDVAIVTDQAGTTRDVITVALNIDGMLVNVSDTAGIRESSDIVEMEGIRRSVHSGEGADLIFWLSSDGNFEGAQQFTNVVRVHSKNDLINNGSPDSLLSINTVEPNGIRPLLNVLSNRVARLSSHTVDTIPTRERHRQILSDTCLSLENSLDQNTPLEIRSEHLRVASDCLGRLSGKIDAEDLLDVIFSEFCIGK